MHAQRQEIHTLNIAQANEWQPFPLTSSVPTIGSRLVIDKCECPGLEMMAMMRTKSSANQRATHSNCLLDARLVCQRRVNLLSRILLLSIQLRVSNYRTYHDVQRAE